MVFGSYQQGRTREGARAGTAMSPLSLLPQDTGLYYHRYLQEVINVLETDGHFREKLQAANAEDIKVHCGWVRVRWVGMRGCVLRGQSLSLGKKSLLQAAQLGKDLGRVAGDRMCG